MIIHESNLWITIFAESLNKEELWRDRLNSALKGLINIQVYGESSDQEVLTHLMSKSQAGVDAHLEIALIDVDQPHLKSRIEQAHKRHSVVVLVVSTPDIDPRKTHHTIVDDVLLFPFHSWPLLSMVRHAEGLRLLREVEHLNASLDELVEKIHSDLKIAQKLHETKVPQRYESIRSFQVAHRYLAGARPGGDHFDIAESKSGEVTSFIYFNSSSYGLSDSILTVLMKAVLKVSLEQWKTLETPVNLIKKVVEEILIAMGPKDEVSLFFGVYTASESRFRFINLGNAELLVQKKGLTKVVPRLSGPLKVGMQPKEWKQETMTLKEGDRLVLVSKGFVKEVGSKSKLKKHVEENETASGLALLNEFVLRAKLNLSDPDSVPNQDCVGVVLDVKAPKLKLAK